MEALFVLACIIFIVASLVIMVCGAVVCALATREMWKDRQI